MIKKKDLVGSILEKSQENTYTKDFKNIVDALDVFNKPYAFKSEYEKHGVVRYGINIHNTLDIVKYFNSEINTISDKYNQEVGDLNGNEIKSNKSGGSKKSKNSKKLAFDHDSCKILHPLEAMLLSDSIENSINTKQKAVLVDIFERDDQGNISIDSETSKPKIHTVVLCRKESSDNEENFSFLVIDPSNSEFSKHLGLLGINKIISLTLQRDIQLEVSDQSYKIYEQNSTIGTGLAFNKFRDCIDIAFKLAKKLNAISEENISFDNTSSSKIFNEPKANDIVKHVTNNKEFDSEIKSEMCSEKFLDYPFRGKQLTDDQKGMELYKKQMLAFHKINNKVSKLTIPAKNKLIAVEEMQNLLTSSLQEKENTESFLEKVDKAYSLISEASSLFGDVIKPEQMKPLGESLNQLSEEFADYYSQ